MKVVLYATFRFIEEYTKEVTEAITATRDITMPAPPTGLHAIAIRVGRLTEHLTVTRVTWSDPLEGYIVACEAQLSSQSMDQLLSDEGWDKFGR